MKNYMNHKLRGKSPAEIAGLIILAIIFATGLAILLGFVVMWLWNWLMPDIFGLTIISYWQAVGLFVFSKLLLGGMCSGGSSSRDNSCEKSEKNDFSKWKHYGQFWKEEGEDKFKEFVSKKENSTEAKEIEEEK